jgi:hypothetical protein
MEEVGMEESGTRQGIDLCELSISRWTEAKKRCWEENIDWVSKNLLVFGISGIHDTIQVETAENKK